MDTPLLVFGVLMAVLAFWMVGAYNRLVALRNVIASAWQQVHESLRVRSHCVGPLVSALRGPMASESAALDALLVAQSQVSAAADALAARPVLAALTGALIQSESAMVSSTTRVLALLDLHAELEAEGDIPTLAKALRESEPRLSFARQLFNEAVQDYNDAVRQFPTRLLARLFGFGTAGSI